MTKRTKKLTVVEEKTETTDEVNLVKGAMRYANRLRYFLGADPCVTVDFNEEEKIINVIVTGCEYKKECLSKMLVPFIGGGKSKWTDEQHKILINGHHYAWQQKVTQAVIIGALSGNPYFKGIEKHTITIMGKSTSRWFGMLNPIVVQAPVDNFGNPFCLDTFTAEDFVFECFNNQTTRCVAWATDRK